jgi:hypothetical protein
MAFFRLNLAFTLSAAFVVCSPTLAVAQGVPDLSGFDDTTRQSIELACGIQESKGPVAYGACLNKQINALRASPGIPSLSGIDTATRQSIELACGMQESKGPVVYGKCLRAQLNSIGVQSPGGNTGVQSARTKRIAQKAVPISPSRSAGTYQATTRKHGGSVSLDPIFLVLIVVAFIYLTPILWVLFSSRSHGGAKLGWFLVAFFFSWLGLAVFLIVTQAARNRAST